MTDDRTLLLGFLKGKHAPAAALWERHAPRVRAHAITILRESHGADDVTQQVFLALLKVPARRADDIRDVPAYLAQATRRACLTVLRSRRRERDRRAGAASITAALEPDSQPDERLARIDALPRAWREVLVLKHACGLTFDQIATALGTPRTTIASRHAAAMEALRSREPDAQEVPS